MGVRASTPVLGVDKRGPDNVALITMLGRARRELAWLEKRLLHLAPAGADVLPKEASCSFRQQCDEGR